MTNKLKHIIMPDGTKLDLPTGNINDIELNNPYSLFDSKYSDHELNNLSWLKSEGQWNAKAVYTTAYDKLLKVYNGTETVEGLSVKLSTETYTDYDFVLNTANETFRLPLLDGSEDLPSDRYDDLELKASKSTYDAPANGYFSIRAYSNTEQSFHSIELFYNRSVDFTKPFIRWQIATTASIGGGLAPVKKGQIVCIQYSRIDLTNSQLKFIYAKGNGSLYYYVGETVQNANLIDAGRIGEALVDKTSMIQASLASAPSNVYDDLTLLASGQPYTAPETGWFFLDKIAGSAGAFVTITNNATGLGSINTGYSSTRACKAMLKVAKGDTVKVGYTATGDTRFFRFYYDIGASSVSPDKAVANHLDTINGEVV